MRYSLLKKSNQDKLLVRQELEKLFDKYNVKLNILQYKEERDGKFYPGYVEYKWDNDKGYKKLERILNKYDWEFFFYFGEDINERYNDIFPLCDE